MKKKIKITSGGAKRSQPQKPQKLYTKETSLKQTKSNRETINKIARRQISTQAIQTRYNEKSQKYAKRKKIEENIAKGITGNSFGRSLHSKIKEKEKLNKKITKKMKKIEKRDKKLSKINTEKNKKEGKLDSIMKNITEMKHSTLVPTTPEMIKEHDKKVIEMTHLINLRRYDIETKKERKKAEEDYKKYKAIEKKAQRVEDAMAEKEKYNEKQAKKQAEDKYYAETNQYGKKLHKASIGYRLKNFFSKFAFSGRSALSKKSYADLNTMYRQTTRKSNDAFAKSSKYTQQSSAVKTQLEQQKKIKMLNLEKLNTTSETNSGNYHSRFKNFKIDPKKSLQEKIKDIDKITSDIEKEKKNIEETLSKLNTEQNREKDKYYQTRDKARTELLEKQAESKKRIEDIHKQNTNISPEKKQQQIQEIAYLIKFNKSKLKQFDTETYTVGSISINQKFEDQKEIHKAELNAIGNDLDSFKNLKEEILQR